MAKKKAQKKAAKPKKAATKVEKPAFALAFEEIEFTCANCGKVVRMIKQAGMSAEGLLCQRCSLGEADLDDADN